MTFKEFNLLDEIGQTEALISEGVLIAERIYKEFKIMLYQISQFYVEVYYHLSYDVIQGFRSFNGTNGLEPYFAEIDIDCLIN
jgi:hypothetical protein